MKTCHFDEESFAIIFKCNLSRWGNQTSFEHPFHESLKFPMRNDSFNKCLYAFLHINHIITYESFKVTKIRKFSFICNGSNVQGTLF